MTELDICNILDDKIDLYNYSHYDIIHMYLREIFVNDIGVKLTGLTTSAQLEIVTLCLAILADQLDVKNTSKINIVGRIFKQIKIDMHMSLLKKFIGIDRLVRFGLDMNPVWEPILQNMNNRYVKTIQGSYT